MLQLILAEGDPKGGARFKRIVLQSLLDGCSAWEVCVTYSFVRKGISVTKQLSYNLFT